MLRRMARKPIERLHGRSVSQGGGQEERGLDAQDLRDGEEDMEQDETKQGRV